MIYLITRSLAQYPSIHHTYNIQYAFDALDALERFCQPTVLGRPPVPKPFSIKDRLAPPPPLTCQPTFSSNIGQALRSSRPQSYISPGQDFLPSNQILQKRQQPLFRSISDHLCSACRKSCFGESQPRHSHLAHHTRNYKRQDLVKSTETLGSAIWGSGARRHIGERSGISSSLSEARSQLRSLAWGSQIQIVQPSAAFHTRTRSEWWVQFWLPAGIVRCCSCCSSFVSSTTEKLQNFRPHHRMCAQPLPIINHPPLHPSPQKSFVRKILLWSSTHHHPPGPTSRQASMRAAAC